MKAACVVLTDNTDLDLYARFLSSLCASDFPKDAPLTLMPPGYSLDSGRTLGVQLAVSSGAEFVVLSDTDIVVPPAWWTEVEKAFSDPKVGIVVPLVPSWDNAQGVRQKIGSDEWGVKTDSIAAVERADLLDQLKNEVTDISDKNYVFDGFVVFRSSYLKATGAYPRSGYEWAGKHGWKIVISNRVVVDHNKGHSNPIPLLLELMANQPVMSEFGTDRNGLTTWTFRWGKPRSGS